MDLSVVTQPDKPKGRGKQMMPTPVKEAAEKHGLPVYQPRRVARDAERQGNPEEEMEPDVIVVVAFGQIITKEILEMPKYGCINVHASCFSLQMMQQHRSVGSDERVIQ